MRENHAINDDLLDFEQTLKTKFQPITPDQQFVGVLRERLEHSSIYQKQRRVAHILITTAGGLLFGLIIFLIGKGLIQESQGT